MHYAAALVRFIPVAFPMPHPAPCCLTAIVLHSPAHGMAVSVHRRGRYGAEAYGNLPVALTQRHVTFDMAMMFHVQACSTLRVRRGKWGAEGVNWTTFLPPCRSWQRSYDS